ncbi:MAG: protein kinase domain-containing protein, partial [Fimbriiglobus sp.]
MRVTLIVTAGPLAGQVYPFEGHDIFLVGRSPNAHCRLPENDPYFSRIHFLVEVNPPRLKMMDMGSLNGTFVNGRRVETIELQDGDEIKAGHTLLSVKVHGGPVPRVRPGDAGETKADMLLPGSGFGPGGSGSSLINFDLPAGADADANSETRPAGPGLGLPDVLGPMLKSSASEGDSRDVLIGMGKPRIPGYDILDELGSGNMGMVWRAKRRSDGLEVAVKTILPSEADNPVTVQRFLREAEVLEQFDHPNVVRFYETGQAGRLLFFAMEHVKGTDVGKVLKERPRVEPRTAIRLAIQVLDALAHAHSKGMVHRDIKPANVLLADLPDGKRQVKLADFGLARVYRASSLSGVTMHGDLGGTPAYMPPEQITNYRDVMPSADQYSTAAMLYHMLTGKYIFDLPPMPAGLLMILNKDPVPLRERRDDLPEGLEVV